MEIIEAVLTRIGLQDDFDVLQSAEHEPYGKPHPAVYIECARRLGVAPTACLALEDSPAGVLAAKAAKMKCIAIPPHELRDDSRYCIADLQLDSIEQFGADTVAALGRSQPEGRTTDSSASYRRRATSNRALWGRFPMRESLPHNEPRPADPETPFALPSSGQCCDPRRHR